MLGLPALGCCGVWAQPPAAEPGQRSFGISAGRASGRAGGWALTLYGHATSAAPLLATGQPEVPLLQSVQRFCLSGAMCQQDTALSPKTRQPQLRPC